MKQLFKYIFLFAILTCVFSPSYTQKRNKQSQKTSKKAKTKKPIKANKKKKQRTVKLQNSNREFAKLTNKSVEASTIKMDTIPEKVVTILSDFKPQLKQVAKINFNNASVQNDTSSLHIDYNIPSQNLSFQYKPISLVPRSYKVDSVILAKNNGSVKIGFGNYLQRDIELNYNFNDAYSNQHTINVYNNAYTGLHHLQTLNDIGLNYYNSINLNDNNRIISNLYYKQSERNRYGMVPDSSSFPISNYKQNYYLAGVSFSWINDNNEKRKLQYIPIFNYEHFEGFTGATNNWVNINNKFSFNSKSAVKLKFDLNYSFNQLKSIKNGTIANYYVSFNPTIQMNKFGSTIDLGISPINENGKFNLYPIFNFSKKLNDTNYTLNAGWNTIILNNQYTTLVTLNPWLNVPNTMELTTHDKKFVEVKINAGKRLDYVINFSLNNYKNLALFNRQINVNPAVNGLLYNAIFEKEASTIELEANIRYQFSDKLLVINKLKYIQFNSLLENAKPWGILPLELDSKINWLPNNKWNIAGGLKFWTGATMFNENSQPIDMKNALVLNAMVQYKLTSKWSTWVKGENLLDRPYERWLDYPSLGVQLMGGVVYSFRK
jgi:hypothetical protein